MIPRVQIGSKPDSKRCANSISSLRRRSDDRSGMRQGGGSAFTADSPPRWIGTSSSGQWRTSKERIVAPRASSRIFSDECSVTFVTTGRSGRGVTVWLWPLRELN